ncbi:hypothetical protein KC343_g13579 [Hortaea werneckii]|nr:hypothetical protein KC352_g24664 [Hortaea werneckii]KAI7589616.1 hypothetical protein KC346_g16765 [Hortaea werneckii]KAI7605932.1 hypothetical protein KC343_g13579 [Hortaea werneckii]KAI7684024.1 hypothetical protein KC322_g13583 [Hortaea werneckii]
MGVLDFDCAICGAPFKPSALINTLTQQQRRETQPQPPQSAPPQTPRQNGRLRTKSKSTPTLSTTSLSSHLAALHVSSSSNPHNAHDAYEEDLHARLAWLRDLRMLAQDPQTGRAYLTGLGNTTDLGWALVGLSDEEEDEDGEGAMIARNLFVARGRYGEGTKLSMSAYSGDREGGGGGGGGEEGMASFPLHVRCWELMRKAWRMRRCEAARQRGGRNASTKMKDDGLDLKILREVMAGLLQGSRTCLGGMDYQELQPSVGTGLWEDQDQAEAKLPWLYDPVECPSALEAYEILTERQGKASLPVTAQRWPTPLSRRRAVRHDDPFDQLPVELVHSILTHVDASTLLDILSASPSVAACCDTRFWRNRLRQDMPYLFELNDGVTKLPAYLLEGCEADWERLYRRLLGQAHCRDAETSIEMGDGSEGVASRRRVWECVGQILDLIEAQSSGSA